ncbi:MAG: hypothetical protein HFJ35_05385 [Clostridia bacterium]|nr:hypothetical protein [Clostridia bacterium]
MLKDEMYLIEIPDKRIENIKIVILVLLIILILVLILITKNALEILQQHKVYKQYEEQLIALSKQEEDKKAEIEKKRQEKIPTLTRRRKS